MYHHLMAPALAFTVFDRFASGTFLGVATEEPVTTGGGSQPEASTPERPRAALPGSRAPLQPNALALDS